jgi:hypothetical protein
MELGGMFFDVSRDGDEILIDERCGRIVRIGFGFQPNARHSVGGCAEVDQQRLVARFRLGERGIRIFVPLDRHLVIPPLGFVRCPFLISNEVIVKLDRMIDGQCHGHLRGPHDKGVQLGR